ncbi:hypothetical protein PPL_01922 [Heterostelium album PN500]|uniref:Uncharacterized protein n=1 Tax=Heterostelium pallidum (strain ATCC 26659 / Pp 5 / PN500) TaxID=670386 RepID=D3B0V5_HETP5|nr:hypothetical protein PPL_01922 [Heterostelium album PN500]EFA84929.1 hypothetical protein PPL_01922 [Heterostelium album PN500]|eukprot:XP_020437039.1 hypothetical protein PPL_01922 [Heterostelium album PN500]
MEGYQDEEIDLVQWLRENKGRNMYYSQDRDKKKSHKSREKSQTQEKESADKPTKHHHHHSKLSRLFHRSEK